MPTRGSDLPLLAVLGADPSGPQPSGLPMWYIPPEARRTALTLADVGRDPEA